MPSIIMPKVRCPLCELPMVSRRILYYTKHASLYACQPCKIGIYDFDPAFNKWRDADKEIPCPKCGNKMNWFVRYIDGYFKARCPYCKIELQKEGDVKFGSRNQIILPEDMETDPIEEPVTVFVPLNKLKRMGQEFKQALKNKLRRRSHDNPRN